MKGKNAGKAWFDQARSDFLFARSAFKGGYYAQACFMCQQAVEKALKGMLYARGARKVTGHSTYELCEELKINSRMLKAAGVLDQYYVSSRYPDALGGATPSNVFTKEQTSQALEYAEQFIKKAEAEFRR